jgi:hypothetical protein
MNFKKYQKSGKAGKGYEHPAIEAVLAMVPCCSPTTNGVMGYCTCMSWDAGPYLRKYKVALASNTII